MNRNEFSRLARIQLTQKFPDRTDAAHWDVPRNGWIQCIRTALGMTSHQLAVRLNVTQPAVSALEHNEASGAITLNSLKRAADALNCDVVYTLVPRQDLESIVKSRATEIANKRLQAISHSMQLEDQATDSTETNRLAQLLVERLLNENPKHLWDE